MKGGDIRVKGGMGPRKGGNWGGELSCQEEVFKPNHIKQDFSTRTIFKTLHWQNFIFSSHCKLRVKLHQNSICPRKSDFFPEID